MIESQEANINLNESIEIVSNLDFTLKVELTYIENIVSGKKKVVFEKCIFRKGIFFKIDTTNPRYRAIESRGQ